MGFFSLNAATTYYLHSRTTGFYNHHQSSPIVKIFQTRVHTDHRTNTNLVSFSPFAMSAKLSSGFGSAVITRTASDDLHDIDQQLLENIIYDSLVWCSLHGLVVGDRNNQRSGTVPGVGLVHAPVSLFPTLFPESHWKQACELAPVFNELADRISLDGEFLQHTLSRTKKADNFTSRLLDIHSKMLDMRKKEVNSFNETSNGHSRGVYPLLLAFSEYCPWSCSGHGVYELIMQQDIRLGLHRSDYMLDEQTKLLLQIEMNTISSSFAGLGCLISDLHRSTLKQYGKSLGLDHEKVPKNAAVNGFAEALAKAWSEYGDSRAVVMVVVQPEERNMYDQHWLCANLGEKHGIRTIRKTLADVDKEAKLQSDGTLVVGADAVSVVYFRAGYTPSDYPSESEWSARLLMEQSSAVKCPSISYHLAGTKKVQQELAKPDVLGRFLEKKEDIARLTRCFAGLWSLDESDITRHAIEKPELFVMKPQREGGGNNIYGDDVREMLLKMQREGSEENAAYILMQRIFPAVNPAILLRDAICLKDHAISELGIYGTYLRNKDEVIINDQCGYLMRTKVSSSNEGGVAAGFAVLDSIYLT